MSKFLFGDGFAISGGDGWRVRRRAVGPSLHRAYLETMIDRVFGPSGLHLNDKLQARFFRRPGKEPKLRCRVARGFYCHCPILSSARSAHTAEWASSGVTVARHHVMPW